jgi:hypothetical protein
MSMSGRSETSSIAPQALSARPCRTAKDLFIQSSFAATIAPPLRL